ncbi:DUF1127 domain-containing protein [Roseibium sp.]|uniref:DUF1127 domain-containing protein n=1 Tax=Roseibium sp. TaxID=1936156 RepID=UPI003A97D172
MVSIDTIFYERSRRRWLLSALLIRPVKVLALWRQRARSRKALANLSDAALADIGLTREAAVGEAVRPFWQSCHKTHLNG